MSLAAAIVVTLPACEPAGNAQPGNADGVPADSGGDDNGNLSGPTTTGAAVDTGTDAPAADDNGTTGSDPATAGVEESGPPSSGIKLDVAAIPDAPDFDTACRKVDFLFVIDNSGSMYSFQQALVNNFPVFIDGIQSSLESVMSYQVGVVTTDAYSYNVAGCTGLSSLVVKTGGGQSSNTTCGPYSEGYNFMTEADDLASSFACAAQVGTSGDSYELTMQAVEQTLQRVEGGPGQCNEGFIREDALLVIVIITDEADGPGDPEGAGGSSPGTPDSWFQTVVDAKDGLAENVVVMSLLNYAGGACPPSSGISDGQNIADFTAMFGENGFLGGICEADYGPIFQAAVGVIDQACENFVTPN